MSITEKTISSSLHHLELQLADKNPALLQAFRLYHELDQLAYELGLIGMDDSLASKTSWSPIITVIGESGSGKEEFIHRYLNTEIPVIDPNSLNAQFTVLVHRNDESSMMLPGTAVDGDSRYPFYHISERLEQIEKGESRYINTYLDLKTHNSHQLKDKMIISAPGFSSHEKQAGINLIRNHISTLSDLVFVFFDANQSNLEECHENLKSFFEQAALSNNPNKFIYIIHQNTDDVGEVNLASWKQKLSDFGLKSGQFFVLSSGSTTQQVLDQKLANIDIESAYRILHTLEQHIIEFETVVIREVTKGINLWKDRTHFTVTLFLSVIAFILVAGEIQFGLVEILLDPFVASISLFLLVVTLIPFHLYSSKIHAKFIIKKLQKRQTELGLIENLAALFNKGLTFWRILLPIRHPIGWTKDKQETLGMILTRAKGLVQALNNTFNASANTAGKKEETFLNL